MGRHYETGIKLLDIATKLDRPIREYFVQNAYYTPSGILSQRDPLRSVETVGAERVMFSTDYPYKYSMEFGIDPKIEDRWVNLDHLRDGGARRFLEEATPAEADKELIAHGHWERILASREGA